MCKNSLSAPYLLKEWMDFYQASTDSWDMEDLLNFLQNISARDGWISTKLAEI